MKIDVKNLLKKDGEYQKLELKLPSDESSISLPDYKLVEELDLQLNLTNLSGVLQLEYTLKYVYDARCARCLEQCSWTDVIQSTELFFKKGSTTESTEDAYTYSGNTLDLTQFLIDTLESRHSMKYLCSDSCEGLCCHCGKNLNHEKCVCNESVIDPRLEIFREFLDNSN